MYNRYVRNGDGIYQRVSSSEEERPPGSAPPRRPEGAAGGLLSQLLGKLQLEDLDTGDLLLLAILFLLFKEGGDEELLIALGLLLIL